MFACGAAAACLGVEEAALADAPKSDELGAGGVLEPELLPRFGTCQYECPCCAAFSLAAYFACDRRPVPGGLPLPGLSPFAG